MIKIIVDSTSSLSEEIIKSQDISVVPLTVNMDGKNYVDYKDITPDEFYKKLPTLKKATTTIEATPQDFIKVFEEELKKGFTKFFVITLSSTTSDTYKSALIAKDMFLQRSDNRDVNIHVMDSMSISHAPGYIAMKIAKMCHEGANLKEIADCAEIYKTKIRQYCSLADLHNLVKTGRLSVPVAFLGKLMNVEPVLTVNNGVGEVVAKLRGKKNVYQFLIDEFIKNVDIDMTDYIIIGYSSEILYANELKDELVKQTGFNKMVYIMQTGPCVGAYTGLGSVELYFMEK